VEEEGEPKAQIFSTECKEERRPSGL
jgi:hypothetical protein